jgi:excisionase family DNA binding protein
MPVNERQIQNEVRLMNVREAAQYLGTTPATLYTKIWRREIPFIKLGRSVRFDVRDLDQLIEDAKVRPRNHLPLSV